MSSSNPESEAALHRQLAGRIRACAHRGDMTLLEELLEQLIKTGCEVTLDTYNDCIHTCSQAGDIPNMRKFLQMMEASGLQADLVTYNSAINCCAAVGDPDEACRLLLRMRSEGIQPNAITYGTICKVFARQGAVQQVEGIMQQMEDSGTPLNEYFYATLISACGAADPPDRARSERALNELIERGLRPQSVKRALFRVLGEERTSHLFKAVAARRTAAGARGHAAPPRAFHQDRVAVPAPHHGLASSSSQYWGGHGSAEPAGTSTSTGRASQKAKGKGAVRSIPTYTSDQGDRHAVAKGRGKARPSQVDRDFNSGDVGVFHGKGRGRGGSRGRGGASVEAWTEGSAENMQQRHVPQILGGSSLGDAAADSRTVEASMPPVKGSATGSTVRARGGGGSSAAVATTAEDPDSGAAPAACQPPPTVLANAATSSSSSSSWWPAGEEGSSVAPAAATRSRATGPDAALTIPRSPAGTGPVQTWAPAPCEVPRSTATGSSSCRKPAVEPAVQRPATSDPSQLDQMPVMAPPSAGDPEVAARSSAWSSGGDGDPGGGQNYLAYLVRL